MYIVCAKHDHDDCAMYRYIESRRFIHAGVPRLKSWRQCASLYDSSLFLTRRSLCCSKGNDTDRYLHEAEGAF